MKTRYVLAALAAATVLTWTHAQGPIRRLLQPRPAPTCTGPECATSNPAPLTAAEPAPAPKVIGQALKADPPAAAIEKPGKAFCALVRMHAVAELRKQGKTRAEAWRISRQLTDDVIAAAVPDAKAVSGQPVGAFGDGTILQKILDWLNSPAGQAFLKALLEILLHAFAGVVPGTTFGGFDMASGCPPPVLAGTGSYPNLPLDLAA